MPGASSRLNGLKGGRPHGSENEKTKLRRSMNEQWLKNTCGIADRLFVAQLDLALGVYTVKTTPNGQERIYQRPPDGKAIQWMLEQIWGKAPRSIEIETEEKAEQDPHLSEEALASIEKAISYILPKSGLDLGSPSAAL